MSNASNEIDRPVAQVRYDLCIIQYQHGDSRQHGIRASIEQDESTTSIFSAPFVAAAAYDQITSFQFDFLSALGYRAALGISEELNNNTARLVVDTSLRARDGTPARLENASTFRYRDVLGDDDSDGYRAVTREIDSGLTIELTGTVRGNRTVSVDIAITLSRSGTDMSGNGNPPPTSRKRVETSVTARVGEPVVIGGLLHREDSLAEHRFPLLGEIPIVRRLVNGRSTSREETELVMYLSAFPEITTAAPVRRAVQLQELRRTHKRSTPVIYRSEFCEHHGVALLEEHDNAVVVGHWKPVNRSLREALSLLHGKSVALQKISRKSAEAQLALHAPSPESLHSGQRSDVQSDDPLSTERTHNLPPLEAYLRRIITEAVADGATDVSIWKWNDRQWRISARVGGRLTNAGVLDPVLADRVLRHLVVRANLDVLDQISPQDGTVAFPWLPGYRVRVAVVGDRFGRYVALRFLRRTAPDLAGLGYRQAEQRVLITAATAMSGLVLFAGPTGSGKTTGMAALLSAIVSKERKVVSLEDPVEYRIPGAVQIERAGGTLRGDMIAAALRQDPDVLAFGEIRRETHARQLEEAVLSGHLVVSSVHADDTTGVLRRIVSLGMSEAVARRHCRVLCRQRLERTPGHGTATVRLHAHIEEYPWNRPI